MNLTINIPKISKVYSGKAGKCCCGCSGTYWYASAHKEAAGKDRGTKVDDGEVSDKQVTRIVNKILKLVENGEKPENVNGIFYSVVKGKRIYIAYLLNSK